MRLVLLVFSILLLGLAPAHGAGTKKAPTPHAEKAKPGAGAARSPADKGVSDDPEMRAKFDKLGPLLSEIGGEAALIAGGKPDGLFLYAEMKGRDAIVLLFRDRGKTVKMFAASDRLRDLVKQAWSSEPADKRWAAMAYTVQGKAFDTHFLYPKEIDFRKPLKDRVVALMPTRFDGKKFVMDRRRPDAEEPGADETEMVDPVDILRT
ncbi:MAG TPA: hypothetical protein VGE65_06825 [Sphingobium sp.]